MLNINRTQNYGVIKRVLEKLDIIMIYSYVAREWKMIETRKIFYQIHNTLCE